MQLYNMKKHSVIFILILFFISIQGCSVFDYLFNETPKTGEDKLLTIISTYLDSVVTTVNFDELKNQPDIYFNKYFQLRGYILEIQAEKFLFYADPYFDKNYGFYFVNIDNPLPNQSSAGMPLRTLNVGDKITLIAQMKGLSSYPLRRPLNIPVNNYLLSIRGEDFQNIPLFKGVAIFKLEDNYLTVPQWVNAEILEQFGTRR